MNAKNHFQVIIIGGGPAGMATSITLTARGISNCIVEGNVVSKNKAGEALPPNVKPLLKKLGISYLLEDEAHMPYYGNRSSWGTEALEQKEFIRSIYGSGYLLDRIHFEKQLRSHLKNNHGVFYEGYHFKKIEMNPHGLEIAISNGRQKIKLTGSFVVDATGRKASVCSQLGYVKTELDSQFAYVFSAKSMSNVPQQIYVEAVKNGWWYVAPQKENQLTLMFFTLKELMPGKSKQSEFLRSNFQTSKHLPQIILDQELQVDSVKIMPTGTSRLDIPFGHRWIAVGDAAFSYDPISSFGISSALSSGYFAGNAISSYFKKETDAFITYRFLMETVFEAYMKKVYAQYALENRWSESTFWKERFEKEFLSSV